MPTNNFNRQLFVKYCMSKWNITKGLAELIAGEAEKVFQGKKRVTKKDFELYADTFMLGYNYAQADFGYTEI